MRNRISDFGHLLVLLLIGIFLLMGTVMYAMPVIHFVSSL